jgi:hypothetical protein
VRWIRRAETQVHEPDIVIACPSQRGHERVAGGAELAIEDLDRQDFRSRRLLTKHGRNRRAVPKAIDQVVVGEAGVIDADAASHALDVRMGGVHAAVNHGNADATAGAHMECGKTD